MYVDIANINYLNEDPENPIIEIEATDLDRVLLNDWRDEIEAAKPVKFSFNLGLRGNRIYLYKICKSALKEDAFSKASMMDQVMALKGRIINISSNFIAEAEG